MALWGSSRQEREHVVSTVRSLGTSSVAGLAAALSISERRAYRLLRETFRFGPAGLRWDNGSRTVSYQGLSFDRAGGIRSTPPTLSMAAPVPMEAVPLAA
ncbi:MAG TPA: hypothetical protein VJS68_03305, partial [Thermoplasmata archaeon]|nr:hypothetical protein [Thermoplasmata archaeon]